MAHIGILPLGRPTFDVPFAEEKLAAILARLDASEHSISGPRTLLFDGPSTEFAIDELLNAEVDHVLILQITFTDAVMTLKAAEAFRQPLSIWAVPEPRLGGRLRLNAFCGLNLASHALKRAGREFGWLYGDAEADLEGLIAGQHISGYLPAADAAPHASEEGRAVATALRSKSIARIGPAPDGFVTCQYDATALKSLAGVEVTELDLPQLFDKAKAAPAEAVAPIRAAAEATLEGLDAVNQEELDRSLRLKHALDTLKSEQSFDAFAIRCWPETFTEYGGAVCGPVSMLGEARTPCACEADVYGALTQLLMQEAADAPVFLVDLVDMDATDNTGLVWHCGQAPISMRDPDAKPTATIHTNRQMPLLYEFPLKPGTVTLARISQANGAPSLVLTTAEMLKRPMAFT
ncbi:MAG: hypothetical protein AAFY59_13095, partial [Pseudomonadota bacterium]